MLLVYGRAMGFEFVYDDQALIAQNLALADLRTLPEALSHELFHFAPGVRASPYWRPWVTLSYYVDWRVGGGSPWAFHLHNLALTWGCGLLLWRLLRGNPVALALSLAWVLHPLMLEPVANISSRPDLWCAFWMLAALQSRSWFLAALFAGLAAFSKELGVLTWALCMLWGKERRLWGAQLVAAALYVGLRSLAVSGSEGPDLASVMEAGHRSLLLLSRVVLPLPMGPAATLSSGSGWLQILSWVVLLLAAAAACIRPKLRAPALLMLAPVLMVSGLLSANTRYGDGLLVLPILGAVLGLAAAPLQSPWPARLSWVVVVIGALHGAFRLPEWRSEVRLWEAAWLRQPADPMLRLRLARTLVLDEPARSLRLLEPQFPEALDRERQELRGKAYLELGQSLQALAPLLLAVGEDEESLWAAEAACSLGAQRGELRAISACKAALLWAGPSADVLNNLGVLQMGAGHAGQGGESFDQACRLAPERGDICANAARADQN